MRSTPYSPAENSLSQARSTRTAAVWLVAKLTSLAAPGGGEAQLQALGKALRDDGVDARPWRPWEDDLRRARCLHLFGSEPEHIPLAETARALGIPVVLSTIAWFDLGSLWRESWPHTRRLAACGRFMLRSAFPRLPSWRRKLYHLADRLLPNSRAEARQLERYFGVPAKKICVVPNGAEEQFAAANPAPFANRVGGRDFVLYSGRIEPRKNQLGFLRAMAGSGIRVVVLGDVVPGHEGYLAACRKVAGPDVQFVGRIDRRDPLLASAYAACGCLALASWYETPGLVALEAGMSGTPLVLPAIGAAREYFGDLAAYVRPDDARGIRRCVAAALAQGRNPALARLVQHRYSWRAAAAATRQAYETVL